MLDANEEYGLKSPTQEHPNTIWFNITVENIEDTSTGNGKRLSRSTAYY